MWIWLVLLYGVLKGAREICKKKALLTCSSIEVLLIYSIVAFLMVCPDIPNAMGMEPVFYLFVAIKSFIIFIAWICSFKAIKHLPLSLYGVLDLSRVLFATLLGVTVLGESLGLFNCIGLVLVCLGLLMLKFRPILPGKAKATDATTQAGATEHVKPIIITMALLSCVLNAISGLMDKILTKYITSSQLQFWYMLFLCVFYILYAVISHSEINIKKAISNKWIWLLSLMFVIADRALFVANSMEESQITIMTLLKQAGCIVTILGGRFIFKEKKIGHKIVCAIIIIIGIVLGTISTTF